MRRKKGILKKNPRTQKLIFDINLNLRSMDFKGRLNPRTMKRRKK